jgi:hypothetical protein
VGASCIVGVWGVIGVRAQGRGGLGVGWCRDVEMQAAGAAGAVGEAGAGGAARAAGAPRWLLADSW